MDSVFEQLTKIEEASANLLSKVSEQKSILDKELEAKIQAFDENLEKQTESQLLSLKESMTTHSKELLETTLKDAKEYEAKLSEYFELNKKSLVQKIVQDILTSDETSNT